MGEASATKSRVNCEKANRGINDFTGCNVEEPKSTRSEVDAFHRLTGTVKMHTTTWFLTQMGLPGTVANLHWP